MKRRDRLYIAAEEAGEPVDRRGIHGNLNLSARGTTPELVPGDGKPALGEVVGGRLRPPGGGPARQSH
jgi:hypothetical protein